MRIMLIAVGTRGDVEPFVALADRLSAAGHAPLLSAPENFGPLAARYGVDFAPIGVDYAALMAAQGGMLTDRLKAVARFRDTVLPTMGRILDDTWSAAEGFGPDVVVADPKALGGPDIADRLGAESFLATTVPLLVPTGEFPAPGLPSALLARSRTANRLSYAAARGIVAPFSRRMNQWRESALGRPRRSIRAHPFRLHGRPIPVLHAFSEHLVPRPKDWPAWAHLTGFWQLPVPSDFEPPAAITRFLDAGTAPVFVGFGSMPVPDPEGLVTTLTRAAARSGHRLVVQSGWGGLAEGTIEDDSVLAIEDVPHAWLFPRVRAVVHHGGAGTTAAGLRAGRPTIVCPVFGDQPFWGGRVKAVGAGPPPIPLKRLDAERLSRALVATSDPGMLAAAEAIGEKLAAEDGAARAARIVAGPAG